jgi:hypothetical protein
MLLIELPADESECLEDLAREHHAAVTLARRKRFDGLPDFVQALVVLTPVTLPVVAKIVTEQIKSRRHISVKYKGVEVRGLADSTVISVLQLLMASEAARLDAPSANNLPDDTA